MFIFLNWSLNIYKYDILFISSTSLTLPPITLGLSKGVQKKWQVPAVEVEVIVRVGNRCIWHLWSQIPTYFILLDSLRRSCLQWFCQNVRYCRIVSGHTFASAFTFWVATLLISCSPNELRALVWAIVFLPQPSLPFHDLIQPRWAMSAHLGYFFTLAFTSTISCSLDEPWVLV